MKILAFLITFLFSVHSLATGLKNGQALQVVNDDVPLEYVSLVFPGGAGHVDQNKQGLTDVLAQLLEKGPKGTSEAEFKKQLFLNNTRISFSAGNRAFIASVVAPTEKIDQALAMAKRVLLNPKFEKSQFDEVVQKATSQTISSFERMSTFIFHFGPEKAFKAHPATREGVGTPTTFKNLQLKDVEAFHKKYVELSNLNVFVLGRSSKSEMQAKINNKLLGDFIEMPKKKLDLPNISMGSFAKSKMLFHKKAAADNQLLWIMPITVKPYSRDYVVAHLAMQILGGSQGHLGKTLREVRGLTYHAGSYLRRVNKDQSYWMIYTFGKSSNVPKLLTGVDEVFKKFKSAGATDGELKDARSKIRTLIKKNYELPKDELSYQVRSFLYGYPKDGIQMYLKYLEEIQLSEINSFIANSLSLKKAKVFLMGDKKQVSKYFRRAKVFDTDELL